MTQAVITFHLPQHRQTALAIEGDSRIAEQAYDSNIGAYFRFLEGEAEREGYRVATDPQSGPSVYSIVAENRERKIAAHDWLDTQPDIWNWIP